VGCNRIRQKSNVEHQVAVRRHSVAITEAGDVYHGFGLVPLAPEPLPDEKLPSSCTVNFEGVDGEIGHGADGRKLGRSERMLLVIDCGAERVRAAGFADRRTMDLVVGLQENQLGVYRLANAANTLGKTA